jgi:hypothetical protein
MIAGIPRRLRLVFGRQEVEPTIPELAPYASPPPTLEFTAYAGDSRASGWISLDGDRLTDMLNTHDELELVDVLVESHEDGHAIEAHDLVIGRDELYAVKVAGPRGDPGRRIRTRPHPISLQVGPYAVSGYLHALPGGDPIASFRHRRASMVPLTDAWIEYDSPDGRQRIRAETLVVNRNLTDWIALASDEDIKFPEFAQTHETGGLLKDFTGSLRA